MVSLVRKGVILGILVLTLLALLLTYYSARDLGGRRTCTLEHGYLEFRVFEVEKVGILLTTGEDVYLVRFRIRGNESASLSLTVTGGRFSDYSPTTSEFASVEILDKSDYSNNTVSWRLIPKCKTYEVFLSAEVTANDGSAHVVHYTLHYGTQVEKGSIELKG